MADTMTAPKVSFRVGRSTWILTICQALYFAGVSVDLTLTAVVGLMLAPTPSLATAPLATISVTGTLCSIGAGLVASKIGYPKVMTIGAATAVAGGALSAVAIGAGSFWLLCCGTGLVGAYRSTGGYIRYMAADLAPDGQRDRALSFILYGGLLAAFGGPFAATEATHTFHTPYVGSYLLVAVFALGNIGLMALLPRNAGNTKKSEAPDTEVLAAKQPPIPLAAVRGNPDFQLGLVALAGAGMLMTMVMAMGPLANHEAGHSMSSGATIIQWHLVGMFAPAIISGNVLSALGPRWTGAIGAALLLGGGAAGVLGTSVPILLAALAMNGVGWNFLYLAGSSLMVRTYPAGRGGRVQAVAEGTAATTGVVASLSSSAIFVWLGWRVANGPVLTVAIIILALLVLTRRTTTSPTLTRPGGPTAEDAGGGRT